jgi:hypothetical protein
MTAREYFVAFRIGFGLYLLWYFLSLLPYVSLMYSSAGLYQHRQSVPFPSILPWIDQTSSFEHFICFLGVTSIAIACGFQRRMAAALTLYGLASMHTWNALLAPPSDGYVGWLLLALILIPHGEGKGMHRKQLDWELPEPILKVGFVVFAVSYTLSGLDKCRGDLWISGRALEILFSGPLVRDNVVGELLQNLPSIALKCLTWLSLATELLAAPLSIFSRGRKLAWWSITVMHCGVLTSVMITTVSVAMLLFNLFLMPMLFVSRPKSLPS